MSSIWPIFCKKYLLTIKKLEDKIKKIQKFELGAEFQFYFEKVKKTAYIGAYRGIQIVGSDK